MSNGTPAASPGDALDSSVPMDIYNQPSEMDQLVLHYLRARGHKAAEQALLSVIDDPSESTLNASSLSSVELAKQLATFTAGTSDAKPVDAPTLRGLVTSVGSVGAEELLASDPSDKHQGFRELEAWVDGSLDMYRPEFRPILFPIFCHFYLDLVQNGFRDAAQHFYKEFHASLSPTHSATLHHLSTLLLPMHVSTDELAQRFKNEKYLVRMSRSGFGLLVGWLTEGLGGEATGQGLGFSGEKGKIGRNVVMRVVNNHLRFDVNSTSTGYTDQAQWEEGAGLVSAMFPSAGNENSWTSAQAFNKAGGDLKLGPMPMSEDLKMETDRVMREQAMIDPSAQYDQMYLQQSIPGLVNPTTSDLLPHPPVFKTMDVRREIERIRDARKRIRLEPTVLNGVDVNSQQATAIKSRALPSICAYTLHEVGEGIPCSTFSADNSLMATGHSESYVRLWSLKGEKLRGMRSDFQASSVKDIAGLRKLQEKGGSTTRKLIGHSGPVYSVAFDSMNGTSAPPRYLLSASADATTRLWSMDTMTNVVAYRGHQNPVWEVQWSPLGIYFATASRDKTARLWSTDRTSTLRIYAGHLSDVDCVRFHPNSLYLATGSSDWTARLWDVQKGNCIRAFIGHQGAISTMAFSPDGRYLATAGEDLVISLWDIGSGNCIKKMTGHRSSIYSLAFSAESSLLVSTSSDWTVRCWDVKSAGGLSSSKPRENGMSVDGPGVNGQSQPGKDDLGIETVDLIQTFPTKRTPMINVQFTSRNLCVVAGSFVPPEQRI